MGRKLVDVNVNSSRAEHVSGRVRTFPSAIIPPRKLTTEEKGFVNQWVKRAFRFMKAARRADIYIRGIPREVFLAAYEEVTTSHLVGKRGWLPKQEDKEAYLEFIENLINQHPLTSPKNAVTACLAGNGGVMCINSLVVTERREEVEQQYLIKFHNLNDEDMKRVYGAAFRAAADIPVYVNRDTKTFNRTSPLKPAKPISSAEWKQHEQPRETFFLKDEDYENGFKAFELTGILLRKDAKLYEIHYEDMDEPIQVSEEEFADMLNEGIWV